MMDEHEYWHRKLAGLEEQRRKAQQRLWDAEKQFWMNPSDHMRYVQIEKAKKELSQIDGKHFEMLYTLIHQYDNSPHLDYVLGVSTKVLGVKEARL